MLASAATWPSVMPPGLENRNGNDAFLLRPGMRNTSREHEHDGISQRISAICAGAIGNASAGTQSRLRARLLRWAPSVLELRGQADRISRHRISPSHKLQM